MCPEGPHHLLPLHVVGAGGVAVQWVAVHHLGGLCDGEGGGQAEGGQQGRRDRPRPGHGAPRQASDAARSTLTRSPQFVSDRENAVRPSEVPQYVRQNTRRLPGRLHHQQSQDTAGGEVATSYTEQIENML